MVLFENMIGNILTASGVSVRPPSWLDRRIKQNKSSTKTP